MSRKISKQMTSLTTDRVHVLIGFTYINIFFSTTKSSIAEILLKHWLVVRKNMAPTLQTAEW